MTDFAPNELNTDANSVPTSAEYGDRGDATDSWFLWIKSAFIGGLTDTAVVDSTASGSVIALLKGLLSATRAEDEASASAHRGFPFLAVRRDTAAAGSGTDGDYEHVSTDATGRLRTVATRDPDDTISLTNATAEVADTVVLAAAGVLHSIVGYVASGEAGWIQVHDATSAPADTAVPELSFYVDATSAAVAVNIPLPGHVCTTGITLSWSTTGPTLTSGAAKMYVTGYYEAS